MHEAACVVFCDPLYPGYVPLHIVESCLPAAYVVATGETLASRLSDAMTLVSFHGPYFPKRVWLELVTFLERGGNLAIFGGMPFSQPVLADGRIEPEQDSYTRALGFGAFTQVSVPSEPVTFAMAHPYLREAIWQDSADGVGTYWACTPCLTQSADDPDELGSSGAMDTLLRPLIYAHSATPTPGAGGFATPALLFDQHSGRFRGGRWVCVLWRPRSPHIWSYNTNAVRRLIALAQGRAQSLAVRPSLACIAPGNAVEVVISSRTSEQFHGTLRLEEPGNGHQLTISAVDIHPAGIDQEQRFALPAVDASGLYRVTLYGTFADEIVWEEETGFWVWDERLVDATRGQALTSGSEFFYQGERPFFVFGTTYMDSVVQRHFLLHPNPARWDRDFAQLRAAGINLIRTGVWTAWRAASPLPGIFNEGWLRALDAFVMTACAHGLQVIFTYYAFAPATRDGAHPWLDARALEEEEAYIGTLARRYARVELVSWDLINEPSMGDPAKKFAQRPQPLAGILETRAFADWLKEQTTLDELPLRWRITPSEAQTWAQITPPTPHDFSTDVKDHEDRAMFKAADYTRWSQELFADWAARMRAVIRATGNQAVVGVGQDEAGARPAPQFYARAVDYTTTHPWWNLDALLWDMTLDKTPQRPNLMQEVGVMLTRGMDLRSWRSDEANGRLLERKLFLTLAARGAGIVEWLWHTNAYMLSKNENSIGLVRADGSAKPELGVMLEFGRLAQTLAPRLVATPPAAVWLVIPYTQWFTRPTLGIEATQRAVRTLAYDFGIAPQMIGEYHLQALEQVATPPALVIAPGIQLLSAHAWETLRQYARRGGVVLASGVMTRDAYDLPITDGWAHTLGETEAPQPVMRHEMLAHTSDPHLDGAEMLFDEEKISYVRKAHNSVRSITEGNGRLIWCGLPVELSSSPEALHALYASALGRLSEGYRKRQSPVLVIRRPLADGSLTILVSESAMPQRIMVDEGCEVEIEPERAGAILHSADGYAVFGGCLRISANALTQRSL